MARRVLFVPISNEHQVAQVTDLYFVQIQSQKQFAFPFEQVEKKIIIGADIQQFFKGEIHLVGVDEAKEPFESVLTSSQE